MYNPDKHALPPSRLVQQRADGMMPGCRYSALFKSVFQTALSHLPPCFIPWISSSLLPSHGPVCPVELVSQGVRASSILTFLFISFHFQKWTLVIMWWRMNGPSQANKTAPPLPKAIVHIKSIDFKIVLDDTTYVIIRTLSLMIYSIPSWVVKQIN